MKTITLGKTGLTCVQNGFGALPIQRIGYKEADELLHRAYEGGFRFFDTSRHYTDSEEKLGIAFEGLWDDIFIATKSHALTPDALRRDLETSLKMLRTDHIDFYQFHQAGQCYRPGDGTGMYEAMMQFRDEGLIRYIGMSAHGINVAMEAAVSGLYDSIMFPFSYLSTEKEMELLRLCQENGVLFIAMKGLCGGLLTRSDAAMAFMSQFDGVMPIWGIQRESELDEWLSYMDNTPAMTEEMAEFIRSEQGSLSGDFCRSCGYCMPCPEEIMINQCARMSQLLRRMPYEDFLSPKWQAEMEKITKCRNCYQCASKCPYGLDTPVLLRKNLEDYRKVLSGEISVGV